ncbi:hypothetical protein [Aureispira anguillae]|uniref:Uncharacterized protein n=1 Tax=Aureispira anguillae TaxID=2864201 RepID=A0A915YCQ9_9BACT|nr:hypothetical protein [Aureispira anguillae]BDS10648.1 hypothetical protein AsAng_0013570 [Aureispira anguillae]
MLLFLSSYSIWAQQDSTQNTPSINNWRVISMVVHTDTMVLDSQAVFPNSVLLRSSTTIIADSTYRIEGNQLIFLKRPLDTLLQARFRVFPYPLTKKRQHKDQAVIGKIIQHDGLIGSAYTYNPFTTGGDAFNFSDLDYNGVFARGISLGNSQDLILNSTFNLQVSGKLGDIEILGAITDNNVPLQPEGNTQQLDEFDRIFIQFKYQRQRLIAGDYNIKRPKGSYFMNYYRRLQGGQAFTNLKLGKGRLKTDGSFAVSKGKFARNVFQGEEGNQGPYRLKGANGEQFVIIIAGTERVYIDGKLLTRGADNDYIIDYNLGELTFTPQQLITKDKRIQVEFSYTDLTFLRTLGTANVSYETKKSTVRFNFYSEQDAKGQTLTESLSDSAKAVLQRVGDNLNQAFVSGISIPDQDNSNTGSIFYKLIDTTINNITYDSVLVYSNNPDSAIYSAKFALVEGGGNYIRVQGAANGVVYQWVAPDPLTGRPNGTHQPIQLLTTPKQRQLYSLGVDYKLGKGGKISGDLALSNLDQNTFSEVGNEDNQGFAGRLTYEHKIPLFGKKTTRDTTAVDSLVQADNYMNVQAHYEYLMKEFEFIEPYRPREFSRDWNINLPEKTQEHLYKLRLSVAGRKWGTVAYQFSGLNKDSLYNGYQHNLEVRTHYKGLQIVSNSSLLQSTTTAQKSTFIRPKLDVSYSFKNLLNWKIGAYGELEQNSQIDLGSDTLNQGSFFYNLFKVYSILPAGKNLTLGAHYIRRYDYAAKRDGFLMNTVADDVNLAGEWNQSKASRLKWNLTYRNLRVQDSTLTTEEPKETYLGRLEYILNIKKGFIRSNTIYQLGSGQQQKVEYNYVKVDQGQGTYIWVDRNNDEVQQTNEFEQAQFQDQADYIRVTLLTGSFIRTNNVLFSQSLTIRPKTLIQSMRKKKGKKYQLPIGWDILQRFSTRSVFKIDRKTYEGIEGVSAFNPFQLGVADTALVAVSSSLNNNLYFNRTGVYSIEFGQRDSKGRTLLSTGFETRNFTEYTLRQRLNIKPGKHKQGQKPSAALRNIRLQALLTGVYGIQGNQSEFFPIRDYDVEFYKIEPQFTFLYKKAFRVILKYKFNHKKNRINAQELVQSHDITTELNYSQTSKTNIKASFSIVQMSFDGDPTSSVGYTMTEGLQAGSNYLWNISIAQALSKSIQLTVSYEGRKTGEASNIVHVGRAEIRANF